ncbi:DUF1552 domain-containing protein [Rariglobus hedericola]|uniref:DUF1552 domain-containing protein n=1 Tax=Rariglobus hedericola TaxID=2597822 RepID=A0A556QMM3_9BACT|nr:DUF1552 domain-containing protein [Rariglobus hedericola]TSJ77900.1 DUF1552 domain-containing protein [Rariglobus hedericola]
MPAPTPPFSLNRRQFLTGLGALVSLPIFESLIPGPVLRAAESAAAGPGSLLAPPLRTAFVYVPNGVNNAHWWPTAGAGSSFQLSSSLAALEPHKSDLQIIAGLGHKKANGNGDGPGDHARASATFLTGTQALKTSGSDIRAGRSIDQMIAAGIGAGHRLPSLELSCDPPRLAGNCDSGYSCAYQFNLSWRSENQPLPAERNPRLVFERMFGGGSVQETVESRTVRARQRRSILDFVMDDTRRLQRDLGRADNAKLDEYLTSVREIERRVTSFESFAARPEAPLPAGIPSDYEEHMRLMCDLMVLSFQTRSTPVATLMLASEASGRTFPTLGITEGHHSLSHHEQRADKLAQIRKIDEFYMRQFSYLIGRMKSVQEGEGTLLDNSMVVFGSGIRDGDRHDHTDLPVILAGRAGGRIQTGRYLQLPSDQPMTNLYLSMLDLNGVKADRIGDSTGRLKLG